MTITSEEVFNKWFVEWLKINRRKVFCEECDEWSPWCMHAYVKSRAAGEEEYNRLYEAKLEIMRTNPCGLMVKAEDVNHDKS